MQSDPQANSLPGLKFGLGTGWLVDPLLILDVSNKRIGLIGPTGKWPIRSAYSRNGKLIALSVIAIIMVFAGTYTLSALKGPARPQMRHT